MNERKPTRGIAVVGTRIWLDVSSHSVVLVCNECPFQAIAFDPKDAQDQASQHWVRHKGVEPWGKQFASQEQPCRHDDLCEGTHEALGLCRRHYGQLKYERALSDPNAPTCTIENCQRVAMKAKRTLCDAHDQRRRKGLPMEMQSQPKTRGRRGPNKVTKPKKPCSVDGCERDAKAKGMCQSHYHRAWREAKA